LGGELPVRRSAASAASGASGRESDRPRARLHVRNDERAGASAREVAAALPLDANAATLTADLPTQARAGANARVLLGAAVDGIDRLLAVHDATRVPGATSPHASRIASTSDDVSRAQTPGLQGDVANLLAAAVGRVERVAATTSPDAYDARRSAHGDNQGGAIEAAQRGLSTPQIATDVPPTGGFRGLAQRTLTQARAPSPANAQRLEAEKRLSSDLVHDTLDSRVAESLARVLEREARRHGIDLDEARA
jgi:hypothetical protein